MDLVQNLTASGGGDCKEHAVYGMERVYALSPLPHSPLYLFTDAGDKNTNVHHMQILRNAAITNFKTPINFFLSMEGEFMHLERLNFFLSVSEQRHKGANRFRKIP